MPPLGPVLRAARAPVLVGGCLCRSLPMDLRRTRVDNAPGGGVPAWRAGAGAMVAPWEPIAVEGASRRA